MNDFKTLQLAWYKKLKESGFDDIENISKSGRELLKKWHSLYFVCRYDPQTFEAKEEYYRRAAQFLHEHRFEWIPGTSLINFQEREVWRLHSDGKPIRTIADIMIQKGHKTNKDYVHAIILRLRDIMWSR